MNAKELLLTAAAIVEADPKAWTKGVSARSADGNLVHADSPKAVCWCAIGFINRNVNVNRDSKTSARDALRNLTLGSIVEHNDEVIKTSQEFVSWFRKAADLL